MRERTQAQAERDPATGTREPRERCPGPGSTPAPRACERTRAPRGGRGWPLARRGGGWPLAQALAQEREGRGWPLAPSGPDSIKYPAQGGLQLAHG
jgi:hypothetical protein